MNTCYICGSLGFKTNGKGQVICERLAYTGRCGGFIPYKRSEPKIGRNELCTCGSGKKYKNCCFLKN